MGTNHSIGQITPDPTPPPPDPRGRMATGRRTAPRRFKQVTEDTPFVLAAGLTGKGQIPLTDAVEKVIEAWLATVETGVSTAGTVEGSVWMLRGFVRFATATGVNVLADVDTQTCRDFMAARMVGKNGRGSLKRGFAPARATQVHRRTVLRTMFLICHGLGLTDRDPTRGIVVPGRSRGRLQPLTPLQVELTKKAAPRHIGDTLRPAGLALVLSGCSVTETAWIAVEFVDLDNARVWLPGMGSRFISRWVPLDPWCLKVLRNRIESLNAEFAPEEVPKGWPVAFAKPAEQYERRLVNPTASNPLRAQLIAAGLVKHGNGIRPLSISEYVVNRVHAITGNIEAAADMVGFASIDSVRQIIDQGWQDQWAEQVRAAAGPDFMRGFEITGGPGAAYNRGLR